MVRWRRSFCLVEKGARSTVVFKLASEPPAGTYFEVTLYRYLRPPYLGMRTVVVSVTSKKLPPWNLAIADWRFRRIPAPASREIAIASSRANSGRQIRPATVAIRAPWHRRQVDSAPGRLVDSGPRR